MAQITHGPKATLMNDETGNSSPPSEPRNGASADGLPERGAAPNQNAQWNLLNSREIDANGAAEPIDPDQLPGAGLLSIGAEDDFDWQIHGLDQEAAMNRRHDGHRRSADLVWRLAGHVLFALIGLVVGYYVLCLLDPRGNVLHLPLPGVR
jgi:hypothetical protein